jgi:aerobic carbon-monoxide dehydrogenase medium subunit
MIAIGATIKVAGPLGERSIPASDFFKGIYETALQPDEILTRIEIAPDLDSRFWFAELSRRAGDFAMAGLAAIAHTNGIKIKSIRPVYFGIGDKPTLAQKAADILMNSSNAFDVLPEAQAALSIDLQAQNDLHADASTRLQLARVLLKRCIEHLCRDHLSQ